MWIALRPPASSDAIKFLVGGVAVGKQRVSAIGREFHEWPTGSRGGISAQHVVMKHHLAILWALMV